MFQSLHDIIMSRPSRFSVGADVTKCLLLANRIISCVKCLLLTTNKTSNINRKHLRAVFASVQSLKTSLMSRFSIVNVDASPLPDSDPTGRTSLNPLRRIPLVRSISSNKPQ
jgi:hypothetical protein